MNKIDKQYISNLVGILYKFSVIFCLENSGIIGKIIDLKSLRESVLLNRKLFKEIIEKGDVVFNLKQVKRAYNQILQHYQIIEDYYNRAEIDKEQLHLLDEFKLQLEEQINILEACQNGNGTVC